MLDLMRLFVQVAEEQSYSVVARRLGISQPAVSNQIRALEEKLRVKLFYRKGKGFALTPQGEIVLKYSHKILDGWNTMLEELGNPNEIRGKLRIGASHIPGEYLLPGKLAGFQQKYPKIRFKILIGDSLEMAEKVLSQEVDFAVVGSVFESEKLCSEFWLKDELKLVLPIRHPLSNKESIRIEDLLNYPMIIREIGSGHRRALEEALVKQGFHLDNFEIGLEAGSTETVKNAIRSGLGYSFLSTSALEQISDKELKVRDVDGLQLERGFFLLTRRDRLLERAAQECYDYLINTVSGSTQ